ncbi:GntR family transcriptional regulator [Aquabacterium fontiphilum]|uniref:FadR/GntR family transcriptional regulator n=1 Tax=Aquabacterium fontiphilum TaxID=450365 RepID=UPI001377CEC2|nr:GntR family transcriptional regulator [Aquabacterium fontiphilum]NBD19828.1 GntR family transcriptional regulator [Aquabacterium fontiphilum]
MTAVLHTIERLPLSEALYRQLKDRIVAGDFRPGDRLPSERVLSEETGVNRGAVREAIKRLQQAGLVAVRQGGNHEVLDYLQEAGPELLPWLLMDRHGVFSPKVVRDLMAMRSVLAPEIARAAALHGGDALHASLLATWQTMVLRQDDVRALQRHALQYWQALVTGSQNVAFQLSFNAMRKSYLKAWDAMTTVMADEFRDLDNLRAITDAVLRRDPLAATEAARRHVRIGEQAIARLFGEQS